MTIYNSQCVALGPNGYVICLSCGKEVQEISREVTPAYAQCLSHQRAKAQTGASMSTEKKPKREKTVRAKGEPQPAILWFQEQAKETTDTDTIKKAAEKKDYSPSTISIQLGRLRGMGLLPHLEKVVKEKKSRKVTALKPKAAKAFHPAPKPGQKVANG